MKALNYVLLFLSVLLLALAVFLKWQSELIRVVIFCTVISSQNQIFRGKDEVAKKISSLALAIIFILIFILGFCFHYFKN